MKFSSTIVQASCLALAVSAAQDAFAAHRMALESILANAEDRHDYYSRKEQDHSVYRGFDDEETYDRYHTTTTDEHDRRGHYEHHKAFDKEYDESCGKRDYCRRFAHLLAGDHHDSYANHLTTTYFVEPDSLVVHEDAIAATLILHEHEYFANALNDYRAAQLDLHMALFQEGIMQVKIKASEEAERFAISNTGIGIDWD